MNVLWVNDRRVSLRGVSWRGWRIGFGGGEPAGSADQREAEEAVEVVFVGERLAVGSHTKPNTIHNLSKLFHQLCFRGFSNEAIPVQWRRFDYRYPDTLLDAGFLARTTRFRSPFG